MRWFWEEIDLHIVVTLMMLAPLLCLNGWWLAAPLLVPHGRIYVRAFWDYPAFERRRWAYLAANELLLLGAVTAFAGLRFAVVRVLF